MTTLRPLCIALTGALALSVPVQKAQAATLYGGGGEEAIVEIEPPSLDNTIFDPDLEAYTTPPEPADDTGGGLDWARSSIIEVEEAEVAQEIPEPSALVALLLVGLFPKFCQKKR